jgi:hypothetical protein
LIGSLYAVLIALCFWPGLSGDFLLDDGDNIEQNTAIHLSSLDLASLEQATYSFVARGGLRILPELTLALDYYNWGLNPFAFKATNLAIHVLTMLALTGFLRSLLTLGGWQPRTARWAAVGMALAWALHPIQVSTVLYVIQRMQSLCTLFLVLSLWAWLRMRLAQTAGKPSRRPGLLALLCWLLALASKEDAALFPLYVLLLELTVLGFRAANPAVHRALRTGFIGFAIVGLLVYLFLVVPHYWRWDAYPGRDFSTLERLLTQGRILVMHLGQLLWPLPERMPFFYDNFEISRSLLQPWTTLPALLLIAALLTAAWRLRTRRPLLAFGILFYFAGHFMTSNVIGLELVFEHRNQLPLIGIVLAVTDVIALITQRMQPPKAPIFAACCMTLAALGAGTWVRASTWGNPTKFAESAPRLAPQSPRAWMTLCLHEHDLSGGDPTSLHFDKAIAACERGGAIESSAVPLALVVQYKTRKGTISQADWDAYLQRLEHVVMHIENRRSAWTLLSHALTGEQLDPGNLIHALNIVSARAGYTAHEFIVIGYFILANPDYAEDACQYFEQATRNLPADDASVVDLLQDLRRRGQDACADKLASTTTPLAARGVQ